MTDDVLLETSRAIECLLFASAETLSPRRLAEVLDAEPEDVERAVESLNGLLEGRGLQLVNIAGGYQLATRPEFAPVVQRLLQPAPARLSPQALEVLAIIAYRQPITRPEVDDVRGVNSQHSMASLAEKGLITTIGRKDAPGRPVLYGTTPHFLSTFGLKDLNDLPNLEALRQAVIREAPTVLEGVSQTGDQVVGADQTETEGETRTGQVGEDAALPGGGRDAGDLVGAGAGEPPGHGPDDRGHASGDGPARSAITADESPEEEPVNVDEHEGTAPS